MKQPGSAWLWKSIPLWQAAKVAAVLNRTALFRGLPKEILTDNGSEFTGNILNAWAHDRGVRLHFTDPGCPTQNGYIESFNGKLRDECLNQNWFSNLYEARDIIEQWRMVQSSASPFVAPPYPRGVCSKAGRKLLTFLMVELWGQVKPTTKVTKFDHFSISVKILSQR